MSISNILAVSLKILILIINLDFSPDDMDGTQSASIYSAPSAQLQRAPDVAAGSAKSVPVASDPGCFSVFLAHHQPARARARLLRRAIATGFAAFVHVAVLVYLGVDDLYRVEELAAPTLALSFLQLPTVEKTSAPSAERVAPQRARKARVARTETAPQPTALPSEIPADEVAVATPSHSDEVLPTSEGDPSALTEVSGSTGTAESALPSSSGVPQMVVVAVDEHTRRDWIARYTRDKLRSCIDAHRFYPPEAEEEGIETTVVLRITIDHAGRLLSVTVVRGNEVPILARAALATVQKAQPFPPPPKELGDRITLDVSVDYRIAL